MYCPNRECRDFLDDGKPGEYIDSMLVCPKCGAALVAGLPPSELFASDDALIPQASDEPDAPPVAAPPPTGPLVALAAFERSEDSESLVAALTAAGLEAFQFFDDGRDFEEPGDVPVCTRVLVPDSQASPAARVAAWVKRSA